MAKSIRNTIMLGSLSISFPEMRRNAKEQAAKIEHDAGAVSGTVSAVKHNMAGVVQHKAIKDHSAMARTRWNLKTLPWFDGRGAPRAFNAIGATELMVEFGDLERQYWELVEQFMPLYPVARAQRQFEMGALFNEREWPAPKVLREKFGWRMSWYSLPDSEDIRVMDGVDQSELKKIADEASKREREALAHSMGAAAQKLYKVVKSMHDTMATAIGEPGAKFTNSKLENILTVAELIPSLNLTNDPKLNELAKAAKKLAQKAPDELREDEVKRKAAAKEAKGLADKLSGLFSFGADDEED